MNDNILIRILGHVNKSAEKASDKLIEKFGSLIGVAEADMLAVSDALGYSGIHIFSRAS